MQLDSVSHNERQVTRESSLQRDAIPLHLAPCQRDDLQDRIVDVHGAFLRRGFPDESADPANDIAGSITILDNAMEGLAGLLQVRRLRGEPAQTGTRTGNHRGDRLVHLMGDRGGHLPQ